MMFRPSTSVSSSVNIMLTGLGASDLALSPAITIKNLASMIRNARW